MAVFSESKILLLGAGKMGSALLARWQAAASPGRIDIHVVELAGVTASGQHTFKSLNDIPQHYMPDCIVLAVKPQSMDALLPSLAKKFGDKPLYLSIAAGKTIAYFEKYLGNAPIVRAMPNTPALIGKGISALIANTEVSPSQKALAESLLAAAGEVVWLDDESQMDAVTAISGSGPAYVFLFLEALVAAAKAQGLPEAVAKKLALHTVRGSAALALASEEPFAQLRNNVTSPGGTTEAALQVLLQKERLESLIDEAVAAAVRRAKELA